MAVRANIDTRTRSVSASDQKPSSPVEPTQVFDSSQAGLASGLPPKTDVSDTQILLSFWKSFLRRSTSPDFLRRRFWGSRGNCAPTLLFWKEKHDDDGRPVNQCFWLIKHSISEKTVRSARDKPVYPFYLLLDSSPQSPPSHIASAAPLTVKSRFHCSNPRPAGASLVRGTPIGV